MSAYLVEQGLILEPYEVDRKTNEIKALPEFIKKLALKGVVFAFDAINTQKKLWIDYHSKVTTILGHLKATNPAY